MAEEYYATGHRKNATAKVWLLPGEGRITVNGTSLGEYVQRDSLEALVQEPLVLVNAVGRFDIRAQCLGGGVSGQAGAMRHGIARALLRYDSTLRSVLREAGLLTRDSRVKERKKYGRKRARRGFQFSKR